MAFAVVVFVDMRGFTDWSSSHAASAHLQKFVEDFRSLLECAFPPDLWFFKGLGDGAMLVREVPEDQDPSSLLDGVVRAIDDCDARFKSYCEAFGRRIGLQTRLVLGWGVVRGWVHRLGKRPARYAKDYLGAHVNEASRLCEMARPFGIVIDRADFPDPSPALKTRLYEQTRRAKGIAQPLPIWVTERIYSQFTPREELIETPEVHVAGVCIRGDGSGIEVLAARRSKERKLYKGLFEGCGGQLRRSEALVEGVRRHFLTELGLQVEVFEKIHCFYEIQTAEEPLIPGIRFLCRLASPAPPLVESPRHEEVRWYSLEEYEAIPDTQFISGLKAQSLGLVQRYLTLNASASLPELT